MDQARRLARRRSAEPREDNLAMPAKPDDSQLVKCDTKTLEVYRHHIDPDSRGVAWSGSGYGPFDKRCVVCGAVDSANNMRTFTLKPTWNRIDYRYVCGECCAKAQEVREAATDS